MSTRARRGQSLVTSATPSSAIHALVPILTGIDQPPAPQLDMFLDAAARCFARFGIRRTSVQDVAREIGVDRSTVYRQVGNVPQMLRLLAARDLHRILSSVESSVPVPLGPLGLVETLVGVVEEVRAHPVVAKVMSDDPESISLAGLNELPLVVARSASTLAPLLERAMGSGQLAPHDPLLLAEWLVRLVMTLVLAPPTGGLEAFVSEILLPVLNP